MVSNAINYGIIKSYPAFLGGTLASSLYLVLSATGLGALLAASEYLFGVLKILGAAYLVYLGVATIRAAARASGGYQDNRFDGKPNFANLFKKAFLLGASNPKDIIFFMAFLPQFINPAGNLITQIAVIVVTWIAVDVVCKLIYGLLAKSIQPFLNSAKSKSRFDKSTGGLYVTAGVFAAALA